MPRPPKKSGRASNRRPLASESAVVAGTPHATVTELVDAAPDLKKQPSLPFPVVCVGASAGGLEAFSELLGALPIDTGMAFVLVSHLSPSHTVARGANGPQRIRIVDDNVDAANALAALLRQDDHEVAVAHSGRVGLETAEAFRPRVALIDLGMPGMNGFEVAERLRAAHKDLLLVAVSGYSGEESRRRARDAQFDEYFIKPFDPEALEELLSRRAR